jgi:hypothetical protein
VSELILKALKASVDEKLYESLTQAALAFSRVRPDSEAAQLFGKKSFTSSSSPDFGSFQLAVAR